MVAPKSTPDSDQSESNGLNDSVWRRVTFTFVGTVIFIAVALVVLSGFTESFTPDEFIRVAVITGLAIGYDVVARRIERVRRRTSGPYVTLGSVWTFAAALLLPTALAAGLAAVLYAYDEFELRADGNPRPFYRGVFNVATVVIPTYLVRETVLSLDLSQSLRTPFGAYAPLIVLLTIAVYGGVNLVLVGAVFTLTQRKFSLSILGTSSENLLELATLTLGGLVAFAVSANIWLVLLAVPILALLQRIALVEHLESAASEDGKTGLLNAAAWNLVADRELSRASARKVPATVMLIDLDHFKRVNDNYGHLTGDAVLKAVADCMASVLRDHDLLSRFGGEEFVALLPGADSGEASRVAERLRRRIADVVVTQVGDPPQPIFTEAEDWQIDGVRDGHIRVTVSVGLASFPVHGKSLTDLVAKADGALYEAKRSGRNRVHISA